MTGATPEPESPVGGQLGSKVARPITPVVLARWFQALYEAPFLFSGILDTDGVVLDGNHLSIEGCGFDRETVIGRPFWEGGWWSPDRALARQIEQWCTDVVTSGDPLRTKSHFFIGDGSRRSVDLALFPVVGEHDDGRPATFIVAIGSDITDALAGRDEHERAMRLEADALRLVAEARQHEVEVVQDSENRVRERLARLAGVALDLVNADQIEDLAEIIFNRGFPVLGADGGSIVVYEQGALVVAESNRSSEKVQILYDTLPLESPLPAAYVVRTGQRIVLGSRAEGLAFTPEMDAVYQMTGRAAWAYIPMKIGERLLGSVAVSWVDERTITDDELDLIEAFAAQCAQVLERIRVSSAERKAAHQMQNMAHSLQRSLLTRPPAAAEFAVAARYLPAVEEAQVGGDWYDAFTTSSGSMLFSVGDVAGHDGDAAAMMAQLRNLLRGLAFDSDDSPAVLLERLDRAIADLALGSIATALLVRIEASPAERSRGVWSLRWSSAGHLPPMVRHPNGTVRVLAERSDLLLGFDPGAERTEQIAEIPDGSVVLLYTDGLVERRFEHLDVGITRLADAFATAEPERLDDVCDRIVGAMLVGAPVDDVAMLLVRPTAAPSR